MTSETLYKIEKNAIYGRQLVARRKILAGEVIIDEPALLTGPGFARGSQQEIIPQNNTSDTTDFFQQSLSVCLVCCSNLTASSCIQCSSCGLLLCSEHCKTDLQHSQNECLIFPQIRYEWKKVNRTQKSLYNLVLVIRGLYFKVREVTKWRQINNLDSKSEALLRIGGFAELQDVFNSLSWEMFVSSSGLSPETKNESSNVCVGEGELNENIVEAAQHCLGVMRINAFSSFSESYSRECLFFISSLMSHSCIINTDRQIGIGDIEGATSSRMVVRASVDIEKGEPITTTYLSLLYSTSERHQIMMSSWLFICNCKRCQDPLECEVFSGAFVCQDISKSESEGSLTCRCDNTSTCSYCSSNTDKKLEIIKQITQSRPSNLYDITEVENWLDNYDNGKYLHPNHSIFAHVKLFLCQYYGRQSGGINELSVSQLQRKGKYCQQILSIYDKVCPGVQMCRGNQIKLSPSFKQQKQQLKARGLL